MSFIFNETYKGKAHRTLLNCYALLSNVLLSIFSRRISIKFYIVGHFAIALTLILVCSGVAIYSFVYENMRQNMMGKLSTSTT